MQEMLLLSGPRQVGKTTVSKNAERACDKFVYLNRDKEIYR
jgi:predicted AAA+ superfamily ATPase